MLVLERHTEETVEIKQGNRLIATVKVVEIGQKRVKLGFVADPEIAFERSDAVSRKRKVRR